MFQQKPPKFPTLKSFYIAWLKEIYSAETQISRALPALIDSAFYEVLRNLLVEFSEEALKHTERLETIFEDLEDVPTGRECRPIKILVDQVRMHSDTSDRNPVLFEFRIAAITYKIKELEIAAYRTAFRTSGSLDFEKARELLENSLNDAIQGSERILECLGSISIRSGTST